MNKIKNIILSSLTISIFGLASAGSIYFAKGNDIVPLEAIEGNYYSEISDSLTGDDLLNALHALNNKKRTKLVTYAGFRQACATFDADPDGSGRIISFYTNDLIGPNWDGGSSWNREHVWPNARGGKYVEDDAHMVRPASTSINSERGSKGYSLSAYDPGQYVSYYRGAAARIIFYSAIADTNLKIIDNPLNYDGSNPPNSMGSLSEMLKWNLEYQPNDTSFTGADDLARRTELNRNEQIQNSAVGQGNRNPFIDHPEYACRIWGNTNEKTKEICKSNINSNTNTDVDVDNNEETTNNNTSINNGIKLNCGGNIISTSVILSTISLLGIGLILIKKIGKKEDE